MKKNRKRLMAAFMAVLMVLTLVPTWLLGGIFATTAKADGKEVTLSQMYKDGYILLNKDGKKVYSYEMKDANGTIADIEAVAPQGNLTDKKNYLNVKPSEAVTLDTDKDTVDKDSMPKDGYMKLTVKKDATDLKLYVNTSGTKQTICVVKKEGSDYTWVSKEYKADKAEKTGDKKSKYYTVDFGTVKSGEEYYIFVKASSAKDVAYWGYDITGNFVPVPAPDATKSVTTVTQDTTDTSKIVVNVKDLAVNEKGPAVYYSLQRVKVTYGTDGSPDWTKAEEIYKYTGKETSFSYEDTVSKTGVYYYRVVGKGLGSTDSNGTATTAGVSYEADVKVSTTGDVNKLTAKWADIETATSYNICL